MNGLADLVARGLPAAWREGPVIEELAWPDVLAARAVSDGAALEAVLYPGREPGRHALGLARLRPGRRYRCEGCVESEGVADATGRLGVTVALDGRAPIRIAPVA